jgi:hypothetical protein
MYREQRKMATPKETIQKKPRLLYKCDDLDFIDKAEKFLNMELFVGVHAEDDGIYIEETEHAYSQWTILKIKEWIKHFWELHREMNKCQKNMTVS